MLKVLQKGDKINTVCSIFNKVVYKKYTNSTSLTREKTGISLWNESVKGTAPKMYLVNSNQAIFEYISGISLANKKGSKRKYIRKIAEFYKKLASDFKGVNNKHKANGYMEWRDYINEVTRNFLSDKSSMSNLLGNNFVYVLETLKYINTEIEWCCFQTIPLHRDLHWGNIIICNNEIKIIDFEHFCIGPLEFEFCNSIFWSDKNSIPFDDMTKALQNNGITFVKSLAYLLTIVYFADQMNMARENNDSNKIQLLVKKFSKFFDKNKHLISDYFQTKHLTSYNYLSEVNVYDTAYAFS